MSTETWTAGQNSGGGAGSTQNQGITSRMYEAAADIWEKCLNHPFVMGIGDGTLPIEKFRFYMLQDYVYLFEYAKVFALGIVKSKEPALMKEFAENVHAILNGEMNIHKAYMKRLGIPEDVAEKAKPSLANVSYTSYMLNEAESGTVREIEAAILSCSWSYAEIGKKLAAIPGALDHPFYGEWIKEYVSDAYQDSNDSLVLLMDRLADGCTPAEQEHLIEVFVNCCRYELAFWDMALEEAM